MKRLTRLCLIGLIAATVAPVPCSSVFAENVFSDDFSWPNGPLIGTAADLGGSWAQTGTNSTNSIQTSGGSVALKTIGQDAYAAFSSTVARVDGFGLKTSLDLTVTAAKSAGDYFLHLSDPLGSTSNFYQRLFARSSNNGFQLGLLDTSGAGSATTWGTRELSFGSTYHVDVTWNFASGSSNETFSISLDDVPYLTHSWSSSSGAPAQLAAVNLRQGNSTMTVPTLSLDNLVVTTFQAPPPTPPFDIYTWEYINPTDPSQGKRQSTTLCVDGAGVASHPIAALGFRDLSMAYLSGKDLSSAFASQVNLTNADLSSAQLRSFNAGNANLTNADLSDADLTNANLDAANLADANFSGAQVRGASFYDDPYDGAAGISLAQLYSTASHEARDLTGISLWANDLTGVNLTGQNLTNAKFGYARLTNADLRQANLTNATLVAATVTDANFTGAEVRGANFTAGDISFAQLASTASYQAHDLTGIALNGNLTGWNFAAQNLTRARFSSAMLTGANLAQANLTNADFQNATLNSADLSQVNLTSANLNVASLTRANLSQANLTGANLTGANLTGANLSETVLTDAFIHFAKLSSTNITLDQLYSTASYRNHVLTSVQFVGNDLSGANFVGQSLGSASFYAAKLVGADFANADLNNAEFVNADLSGADLSSANFTYATLALANLSGANLTGANLSGTNLIGTNLTGANISGASLSKIISSGGGSDGRPCGCGGVPWWPVTQPTPTTYVAGTGVTLAQLVTTANYGAHDLSNITFVNNNFSDGNFAGFNLTRANFAGTTFTGADLSGADARGSFGLEDFNAPNLIRPDGHIAGLNLSAGQILTIRDYDALPAATPLPIKIDEQLSSVSDATLRIIFDADPWGSTISFAAGIPVSLDGKLELAFAAGVDLDMQIGRTFDVFDWTGVAPTGAFTVQSLYQWDLSSLLSTGKITFLAAGGLPGDFNDDHVVDARDYTAWRDNLSSRYSHAAFDVWKNHFGGGSGSGGIFPQHPPAVPEPTAMLLLSIGVIAAGAIHRLRNTYSLRMLFAPVSLLLPIVALSVIPSDRALAATPDIRLTQIGYPIWKPADFQLFSAPATPFAQSAAQIFDTILPNDDFNAYIPHSGPYDTELSTGALAGGYVTKSLFTPDAINLSPNGVYLIYMLVPQPGVNGDSRDFESGPVIPNSLFPILNNLDVWLDGVLVDRAPGADAVINVAQPDVGNVGISHLEVMQAIWHPWDDDLAIGPMGRYDLRTSIRDASGSGWDAVVPFRVALPGDYDYSGTVGAEDYGVWKANLGSTTNLDADGNDDHVVDAADYTIYRDNLVNSLGFGSGAALPSVAPLSAGVPEPQSAVLLMSAVAGWRLRQRPARR